MFKRIEVTVPEGLYEELVKHARAQDRSVAGIAVEALEQYNVSATQPRSAANRAGGPRDGAAEPGGAGDSPSPVPGAIKGVRVEFTDESMQSFTHVDAISTRQREVVTLYGDKGPDILLPALGVRWIEVES